MDCSTPGFPVFHHLPELTQTQVHWEEEMATHSSMLVMPSNHLVLYHSPRLLPSIFPGIRVLSNELALHLRWPKYWNFSFSVSPSNEYSGLISFRIDWFDLLAIQGILKSSPIILLEFSLPSLLPGGSDGKCLPAIQETQVQSLSQEDPLQKGMATHSSIVAWRITWTEEPGRLQSVGLQGVGPDLVAEHTHTHTHTHTYTHTHTFPLNH